MSTEVLASKVREFLDASPHALVLEDGAVAFSLDSARYSLSTQHGKCVLHLWSHERNIVRRVIDAEEKHGTLRLSVLRLGQAKPAKLEICRDRDRRSPSAKRAHRAAYERLLARVLKRSFPASTVERLTSAVDLERSFGPVYARALLRQGNSASAVLGVNAQELQASVDAALTIGILWLDYLREREAGNLHLCGLKLFVPAGTSTIVRQRIANLNRQAAAWELYELDERSEELAPIDTADCGNIETRLTAYSDPIAVHQRFQPSIARIREFVPKCDIVVLSAGELAFRLHGLEFARTRLAPRPGSFDTAQEIVFGVGPSETTLDSDNAEQFEHMIRQLRASRGPHTTAVADRLWRAVPERWLESLVVRDVAALDPRLDARFVYSQVPAFSASDRAMIDVLTCTHDRRLALLELKADEDIHLPLQGLDYWARVRFHQQRGEFERFGYFAGEQISSEPAILFLVAPALHIHPATDTLLRYLAPQVPWGLIAIDEHWREGIRVVFRKRSPAIAP